MGTVSIKNLQDCLIRFNKNLTFVPGENEIPVELYEEIKGTATFKFFVKSKHLAVPKLSVKKGE